MAFYYWSLHAELDFEEVCYSCTADLIIEFADGEHGDGNEFDGSGSLPFLSHSLILFSRTLAEIKFVHYYFFFNVWVYFIML